jgi:GNAT superfamily N-acetyltransferase
MVEVEFEQVEDEEQKQEAGGLIRAYLEWLNERLRKDYGMAFEVEAMVQSDLSDPDKFHPPDGRFYLARVNQQPTGVGCLKRLDAHTGELQRMYVLSAARGKGIGRAIALRLIEEAKAIGYQRLRLESLEFLGAAHGLYRSLGFRQIEPYAHNSMEAYQRREQMDQYFTITVFMEMDLVPTP